MSSPHMKCISKEDWLARMNQVKLNKSDLNQLVMNYLVIEGYKDAAEKFQKESGTDPGIDLSTIGERMAIRQAIQSGEVERGIERVNDLNPEILDTNPTLFFHLQQQRLIELIRTGKIEEALVFAQEELAPQGQENLIDPSLTRQQPRFLEELERTMALLAFEDTSKSPLADLMDMAQRQKTASELNAAILTSQCQEKEPKLPTLLKMLLWAQAKLEDKVRFPHINNFVTAEMEDPVEVKKERME